VFEVKYEVCKNAYEMVAHGDAADWQLPVSLPPSATYSTVVAADAGRDPAMTEATTVPPNNSDPASAVRRQRRIVAFTGLLRPQVSLHLIMVLSS
jgi:hypothetical protein